MKSHLTIFTVCFMIFSASSAYAGQRFAQACRNGYVRVPGDNTFKTRKFCIMKWEAKCGLLDGQGCTAEKLTRVPVSEAYSTPWVSISQNDATTECASLGMNYRLISNTEWMVVATNVASVASNWDGGVRGTNNLNTGHSDNNPGYACDGNQEYVETDCANTGNEPDFIQKRTYTLSNGNVIWDLSGNVWEWTTYFNKNHKPYDDTDSSAPVAAWREYNLIDSGFNKMKQHYLTPTNAKKSWWSDGWTSVQGIGKYYAGTNGAGGALRRGGRWIDGTSAGPFAAALNVDPTGSSTYRGFRCVAP